MVELGRGYSTTKCTYLFKKTVLKESEANDIEEPGAKWRGGGVVDRDKRDQGI